MVARVSPELDVTGLPSTDAITGWYPSRPLAAATSDAVANTSRGPTTSSVCIPEKAKKITVRMPLSVSDERDVVYAMYPTNQDMSG